MDENARSGFRLLYRSMKNAPWYRNVAKKSVMVHLIMEVAHESRSVVFGCKRVPLVRGQLVCSAKSLGQECGLSEDQARRALDYFEAEGTIRCDGSRGKGGYTIVTLLNFDAYQRGISQIFSADYGADSKAAPALGFEGVSQPSGADLTAEYQAEDYIIKNIKKDLKHSSSQLANATFDQQGNPPLAAEPVTTHPLVGELVPAEQLPAEQLPRVIPEAAIQTPSGKAWGTEADLTCAQWIFERVRKINPTALAPNWPQWANTIRLMRELDQRSHTEICDLYNWVSRDPFWCANVLSPLKLRQKWDQLTAKRNVAPMARAASSQPSDLTKTMTAADLNRLMQEGF